VEITVTSIADSETTLEPDRLRLVTRYFRELQGLYFVAFGGFAMVVKMELFLTGQSRAIESALAVSLAGMVISLACLPGYYRRRFGTVERLPVPNMWSAKPLLFAVYLAVTVTLVVVEDRVHARHHDISFMPFLWWWAAPGSLFVIRPELTSLRKNYFAPLLLGAVFVTLYPIFHAIGAQQAIVWKALNEELVPVSCVVLGLGDHVTLLRLMPKRISEDDHDG
jgi:hypothetical protein